MQLFSSIHTISLWVNNLAVHPASSLCFGKAISMVTPALMVTPPCQMACNQGSQSVEKYRSARLVEAAHCITQLRTPGNLIGWGREWYHRETGKRVPHVLSRARVDNARRQTGRLAERVGTYSSMMENKDFVCHRRDHINQNKQPQTDSHTLVFCPTG